MRLRAVINAAILISLILILVLPVVSKGSDNYAPVGEAKIALAQSGGRFIPNYGQWPSEVKFRAKINGATVWFTNEGVYHDFVRRGDQTPANSQALDIETYDGPSPTFERLMVASKFVGAESEPSVVGVGEKNERVNFFHGNDPARWQTDLPVYEQIEYRSLYDGIDLVYRVNEERLEYDLRVAPGANYRAVQFEYHNVEGVTLGADGSLMAKTAWGEIIEKAPEVYQQTETVTRELRGEFHLVGPNRFRFDLLDQPDPAYPLIVDPLVTYIFGTGGVANDEGFGIAVDADGNAYIAGYTSSPDFPTQNPLQPSPGGGLYDAFVMKLNATGSQVVYSSYLGGSEDDRGHDIAVDTTGAIYVTGYTVSTDFPLQSPYQGTHGGGVYDAFVTKISPQGNALVYSSYLGGLGDDISNGIAVNSKGEAHLTGQTRSTNFPTMQPLQSTLASINYDAFVTKFNAGGSGLLYSTYLGGGSSDYGRAIDLLPYGNAVVCGLTSSNDFPTLNAAQNSLAGGVDGFVANLTIDLSGPGYRTYLGGSGNDYAEGVSVDADFTVVVAGYTFSTNFPTVNPYQASHAGGVRDLFATRFNTTGSVLVYSTYIGGSDEDYLFSSGLTSDGKLCLTGYSFSTDYPLVSPYKDSISGISDAVVSILSADGSRLTYSTFVGGAREDIGYDLAVDTAGSVYVTGVTGELFGNAPKLIDGKESLATGLSDMFVVKFSNSQTCCGFFTSGYTGNANCSTDGKRNLADITRLIDRVYLSKTDLCCEENGNVDGDAAGKINLADITKLIDHVYISKSQTAHCI